MNSLQEMELNGTLHSALTLDRAHTIPFPFPSTSPSPSSLTTRLFARVIGFTVGGWVMNMPQKTLQETPFLGMASGKVLLRRLGIITECNFRGECRHRFGGVWSLKEIHQVDVGVDDELVRPWMNYTRALRNSYNLTFLQSARLSGIGSAPSALQSCCQAARSLALRPYFRLNCSTIASFRIDFASSFCFLLQFMCRERRSNSLRKGAVGS